mmetsp:Transcript_13412/g.26298  ORF Transcript_13412/g.26298 Transcript_13412/m.26298 type:complete len:578 (-) Transcript_13412:196-1929(-)
MIVVLVAYGILRYQHYSGREKQDSALTPIEFDSLCRYLDGKVHVIPGGTRCDNFSAYMRNRHELISLFAPMRFNPISRHERLLIINVQFGMSFMITAILTSAGLTEYFIVLFVVTVPVMIVGIFLDWLAKYEETQFRKMKEAHVDVRDAQAVVEAKSNNVRLKLKTDASEEYYVHMTENSQCAGCGQILFLVISVVMWIVGLAVSAGLDNESGFIIAWLLGLLPSYAYWFGYQVPIFLCKDSTEEQFFYKEAERKPSDGDARHAMEMETIHPLSEDEIKTCVSDWADSLCCYGKGPAGQLKVGKCTGYPSYYYKFQSFGETRHKEAKYRPYHDGPVDGGTEPDLWDVVCHPTQDWAEHEVTTKVPHSEEVKTCHVCHGSGTVSCDRCGGSGSCTETDNDGNSRSVTCHSCNGSGRKTDPTCEGSGKLLWYKMLIAYFGAPGLDYVVEFTDLPDFLVKACKGKEIVCVEEKKCGPVELKQSPSLCQKSKEFLQRHREELESDDRIRVLKQRHRISMIPIWEVVLKPGDGDVEKDEEGKDDPFANKLFIYGEDKRVYFPRYPQKCCCCDCMDGANCTVM